MCAVAEGFHGGWIVENGNASGQLWATGAKTLTPLFLRLLGTPELLSQLALQHTVKTTSPDSGPRGGFPALFR